MVGIALEAEFRWQVEEALIFIVVLLLLSWGISFFIKSIRQYKYRHWSGILLFFVSLVCGLLYTSFRIKSQHIAFFDQNNKTDFYLLQIDSPLIEKNKTYKTQGKVICKGTGENWRTASGKIMIYLQKDSLGKKMEIGDKILINAKPQILVSPKNPDEFDYKKYLNNNQIYHQVYLKTNQWKTIEKNTEWNLFSLADKTRKKLLHKLKKIGVSGDEYAVIAALVFGNKDVLDKNLFQSYASAGAMHVLAVSGLHVGLVFLIFNSLLFFLNRNNTTKTIKSIVLLILLWAYALLTGMSPSVLRAVTMLSFIIIGKIMFRKTNIYNTIAASVFALLLFNPFIINKVGFQLSYLAVIGIIYLQPKIYHLFFFNNKLIDKLWALTAVSLAAQIATFPLGILYFHQFPTYFLISNLFVIPAATIILYLTFLFMVFSWLEPLAFVLGNLLSLFTKLLNYTVAKMEMLPQNQIQGIVISVFEVYLIYGLIIFIIWGLVKKSKVGFGLAFTFIILLLFFAIEKKITNQEQKEILFFSISKETALAITQGDTCHFIASSTLFNNEDKMTFHVQNHLYVLGSPEIVFHDIDSLDNYEGSFLMIKNNFIQAFDQRIYIPNNHSSITNRKIKVDAYILRRNKVRNITSLKNQLNFNTLIIDGTNNYYTIKRILENDELKNITTKNLKNKYFYLN